MLIHPSHRAGLRRVSATILSLLLGLVVVWLLPPIAQMRGVAGYVPLHTMLETEGQREFLERNGCHAFQGYLFSKPLPPQQLAELLRSEPLMASPPLQPAADATPEKAGPRSRRRRAAAPR